jgi:protein-S-isoprenylcysteine O-methyltransferase Ste14
VARGLELRVPPVVLLLVTAGAMWAVAAAWPRFALRLPAARWIALALGGVGLAIGLAGVAAFRARGTTVDPMRPEKASQLVTGGIYRMSRNPMYLGLLLILAAWTVHLGSWVAAALPVGFVAYMNRFQIAPEERVMRSAFGSSFDSYAGRVRRWL